MASIGGVTTDIVRGTLPILRETSEVWRQPGVDGYGVHLLGLGQTRWRVTAVRYGSVPVVVSWFTAIELLVGSTVTIVTDWGATDNGCFIQRATQPTRRVARHAGGCRGEITLSGVRL